MKTAALIAAAGAYIAASVELMEETLALYARCYG
jgi:hypothetical protein